MYQAEVDDCRLSEKLWAQLRVINTRTQVDAEVLIVLDLLVFDLDDVRTTLLNDLFRNYRVETRVNVLGDIFQDHRRTIFNS